jgi:hypothetical protein
MTRIKRWPDVARLHRGVTLTEMLDGKTAALHVDVVRPLHHQVYENDRWQTIPEVPVRAGDVFSLEEDGGGPRSRSIFYRVTVQNTTRIVTVQEDMNGIAAWARENAAGIVAALGPGIHFGEWWGYKINRGYGLRVGDRRFSLFNTVRWNKLNGQQVPGLYSVPVLWEGSLENDWMAVPEQVANLKTRGSVAVPGYPYPEGLVLYHHEGDTMFKIRIDEHNRKNIRLSQRTGRQRGD